MRNVKMRNVKWKKSKKRKMSMMMKMKKKMRKRKGIWLVLNIGISYRLAENYLDFVLIMLNSTPSQ